MYPNWGFCSIRSKLIKLACWIDVFDHYKLYSIVCDDHLINFFKLNKWFSKIFGVFVRNSMLKPIL